MHEELVNFFLSLPRFYACGPPKELSKQLWEDGREIFDEYSRYKTL